MCYTLATTEHYSLDSEGDVSRRTVTVYPETETEFGLTEVDYLHLGEIERVVSPEFPVEWEELEQAWREESENQNRRCSC